MRLDHLLSKELWPAGWCSCCRPVVRGAGLVGAGSAVCMEDRLLCPGPVALPFCLGGPGWVWWPPRVRPPGVGGCGGGGTLSGSGAVRPGGPGPPVAAGRVLPCCCLGGWLVVWGVVGGLVVNCIVDASIFVLCGRVPAALCGGCVCFVCFFERSVDALASGADEGRGGLR